MTRFIETSGKDGRAYWARKTEEGLLDTFLERIRWDRVVTSARSITVKTVSASVSIWNSLLEKVAWDQKADAYKPSEESRQRNKNS